MATTMEEPWLDKNRMELWLNSPVKEINCEDTAMKGENYLSILKKLEVKTECGEVYPLIVKCLLEVGLAADTFKKTSIFRKEQEMYRNVLQKMLQVLRDAFPDSFSRFSPKSYYTCKSFLVLEDLKAQGFKMEDRKVGLELDQCLLVMRNLARFHASSVILYQQDPDIFEKFQVSFFTEEAIQESMERVWRGMTRSLANELDTWEEEWHKYAEKLRRLEDDIMNRVKEVTRSEDSRFSVLIHGDLWTNNLMFKNKTDGLRFVDFQLAHFTSPALDLHYFITSSTNLETRRKHRSRLLAEYHSTFCETLIALGYKEKLITLEELYLEMDRKSIYGVFTLLGPFAVMQLEPDCGFSFDEALATGWNPGSAMYGEIYKEAVKIMLPLFDSKARRCHTITLHSAHVTQPEAGYSTTCCDHIVLSNHPGT